MAMAAYNATELDDVHRLLPPEILEDIGVTAKSSELMHTPDIFEELAARLAAVLGGGTTRTSQRCTLLPSKPANSSHHQSCRPTPPEFFHDVQRKGAEAWLLLENGRGLPLLAPPAPLLVVGAVPVLPAPAMCRSGGTGVFLPRTGAYAYHPTRGSKPSRNGNGEPLHCSRQQCRQRSEDTRKSRQRRCSNSSPLSPVSGSAMRVQGFVAAGMEQQLCVSSHPMLVPNCQ